LIAAGCGVMMLCIPSIYIDVDLAVKAIKQEKKRRLKESEMIRVVPVGPAGECGGTGE
jgi:hypothetical protein